MLEQLKRVEDEGLKTLEAVNDEAALEAWRVAHLGRSSGLMQVFSKFGQLSKEEKRLDVLEIAGFIRVKRNA